MYEYSIPVPSLTPSYTCMWTITYMKKNISGGARQAAKRSLDSAVSSLLALISRNTHSLSSTPPVYTHQNTSGSAVSELMRFIHHITYIVPAMPRAINWARPLTCTCIHTSWCLLCVHLISMCYTCTYSCTLSTLVRISHPF